MSATKDVTAIDLALVELLRGECNAPDSVYRQLQAKGYVTFTGGEVGFTASGRARAEKLKACEHDLRLSLVGSGGGSALRAVAGPIGF